MEGLKDRWMEVWINGRIDGWIDELIDEMDGWKKVWTNRQMYGERSVQIDGWIYGQTESWIDRFQISVWIDRWIVEQMDRLKVIQIDRQIPDKCRD